MQGRLLETVFAGALIIGGLSSLALYRWVFVDPTSDDDWRAAAAWVIDRVDEQDTVRIEPFWYESALTHLVEVGDQVNRQRDPLLEDLYQFDDIFIVSQASRSERAVDTLPFEPVIEERASFGSVEALRVRAKAPTFHWELLQSLDEARVSRVRGDAIERCTRWSEHERRWDCDKRSRWLYVGEVLREVGDEPRHCIWAHPLDRGRTLRIETTVPPADTIRIRDSFDLRAARLPRTGEALMQVFVDDQLKVEDRIAHDDHDWQAHDIDVSSKESSVELRIEVDLVGSIKDRYFCLNAWAM